MPSEPVNSIQMDANGPYCARGQVRVGDRPAEAEVWLCRCGHSEERPFCSGMHERVGFVHDGLGRRSQRDVELGPGELHIDPQPDGPLVVTGPFELHDADGELLARRTSAKLCRCGQSKTRPYCDDSHRAAGFRAP